MPQKIVITIGAWIAAFRAFVAGISEVVVADASSAPGPESSSFVITFRDALTELFILAEYTLVAFHAVGVQSAIVTILTNFRRCNIVKSRIWNQASG